MGALLAIASGLCWAGLDALRKRLTESITPLALACLLALVPAPFFLAWGWWDGRWWSSSAYLAPGLGATACSTIAYVAFLTAMKRSPLSVTIPLLSLTPVITLALGAVINAEVPSWSQNVGIALVVVGALVLHSKPNVSLLRALREEPGSRYMVVVALLWSLSGTMDKRALAHASVAAHAVTQTLGMGLVTLGLLALTNRLAELGQARRSPRGLTAAVVLSVAAVGLQLLAMSRIYVTYVETTKRAIGVVMALVLGRLIFDEAVTTRKVVGIAIIAGGSALLALSR